MIEVWRAAWPPAAGEGEELSRRRAYNLLAEGLCRMYNRQYSPALLGTDLCHDALGRPYLLSRPDLYISLSHGIGCAAAAAADFPVGVDTERVRPFSPCAARHALTKEELAVLAQADDPQTVFFRLWTLKESYVKARGVGLSYGLRRVSFSFEGESVRCSEPACSCGYTEDHGVITSYCILSRR